MPSLQSLPSLQRIALAWDKTHHAYQATLACHSAKLRGHATSAAGIYVGRTAALEVLDTKQNAAADTFEPEKWAYDRLKKLQWKTIPRGSVRWPSATHISPVVVTSMHGSDLPGDARVPACLHSAARLTLLAMHKAGAAHGNFCLSSFVVSGSAVRLVDLGVTVLQAPTAWIDAEQEQLEALLAIKDVGVGTLDREQSDGLLSSGRSVPTVGYARTFAGKGPLDTMRLCVQLKSLGL